MLTEHRQNVVWRGWKKLRSEVAPLLISTLSLLWGSARKCTESSCTINISADLFYIAVGMVYFGGEKSHLPVMACHLTFHNKSRVMFACGSIEYLWRTVATCEDGVLVILIVNGVKYAGAQWCLLCWTHILVSCCTEIWLHDTNTPVVLSSTTKVMLCFKSLIFLMAPVDTNACQTLWVNWSLMPEVRGGWLDWFALVERYE